MLFQDPKLSLAHAQVPAGVQPGETRVLKGKGAPVLGKPGARGDMFMKFSVHLPSIADPALKMALENLGARTDFPAFPRGFGATLSDHYPRTEATTPTKDRTWTDFISSLATTDSAKSKNKR
jgi:DnaJ-class molecular chaperone